METIRVLLADDDAFSRATIANALRADGYSVVEAECEDEVLTHLASGFLAGKRHGGFDVLLCVANSIAPSELEVLRRAHLSTPIVVMAERSMPTDEVAELLRERRDDEDDEREDPILTVIATYESGIDAFALKALLKAHGIPAFLDSHAVARSSVRTTVCVLERDVARARAVADLHP